MKPYAMLVGLLGLLLSAATPAQEPPGGARDRSAFVYACDGPVEKIERLAGMRFNAFIGPNLDVDDQTSAAVIKAGMRLIPSLGIGTAKVHHPPERLAIRTASVLRQRGLADEVAWWLVGQGVGHGQLDAVRQAAAGFQSADPGRRRPIVIGADEALTHFAEPTGGLILRAPMAGVPWADPDSYLGHLEWLARPSADYFAVTLQTTWPRHAALPGVGPDADQLRLQAYLAVLAGAKGLVLPTRAMLAGPEVREDLLAELGVLGCELAAVGDWLAAAGRTGQPLVDSEAVLARYFRADSDCLIVLVRTGKRYQYVMDEAQAESLTCVVPIRSRKAKAYRVEFPSVRPLRALQVDLQLKIEIPRLQQTGLVLVTDRVSRVKQIARHLSAHRAAAVRHAIRAFKSKLKRVGATVERLKGLGVSSSAADRMLARAKRKAPSLGDDPPANQYEAIYASAREGMGMLRAAQWLYWRRAIGRHAPETFPYTDNFYALPAHYAMLKRFDPDRTEGKLLLEEGFEDGRPGGGWLAPVRGPLVDRSVTQQASRTVAHAGQGSWRIRCWDRYRRFGTAVDAPIPESGLRSRPIRVAHGELLKLSAWVRVPGPVVGTRRGALVRLVFQDAAGNRLDRDDGMPGLTAPTGGWQERVFYRHVNDPRIRSCRVELAVAGIGEAYFDEVRLVRVARRGTGTRPKGRG